MLGVWDVETHQPIAKWGGHDADIRCIVVSPDNQLVASASSSAAPPLVVASLRPSTQNVVDLSVDFELPPGMA